MKLSIHTNSGVISRTVLACTLALSLAACSSGSAPQAPAAEMPLSDGMSMPTEADVTTDMALEDLALSILVGDNAVSGKNWTQATNGFGPIELDKSNGESVAGDGRTLTLAGKTYTRGYGVHANSKMSFAIGGKCRSFTSDIGVDDEVGSKGSVVFQVFGDGIKLYDSGVMTGASATKSIKVDVAGRSTLTMVVTQGTDNNYFDHADWANPYLVGCEAAALPVTGTTPVPAPAPVLAAPVYAGPLSITKGGTYTGAWESLDPAVPAVKIMTTEPVIIENCLVRGRGHLIATGTPRTTITVRGCRGLGLNPMTTAKSPGRFLNASEVVSAVVEGNTFEKTSGIYFYRWGGQATQSVTIAVRRNLARDIEGRLSDGQGGWQTKANYAQFVQFNGLAGIPRVDISWNRVENTPRQSFVEDTVNIYGSSGTADSPIRIHNNLFRGAYAGDPAASYSGGGIMLGDGDGAYQEASNNVVLETSNYGIAVAGGNHQTIKDNLVLGTGKLSDGTLLDAESDAGIYIRDYAANPAHIASSVVASGNTVGWGTPTATGPNNRWDYAINATAGVGINNMKISPLTSAIDPTLLTNAVASWEGRVKAAGLVIGAP